METNDTIFSDITPTEVEATSLQGFSVRMIDFIIDIALIISIRFLIPAAVFTSLAGSTSFLFFVIVILVMTIHRFVLLSLFNKTIGMMICRVKFLNKDLQPLSAKEKLLSPFRTRFSTTKYYKDK